MTIPADQQQDAQLALPSVETTGTILQVYNELAAGKTLKMDFGSLKEAETFRVMVHQYKSKQEEAIKSIGMEMEPTAFSFQAVHEYGKPIKITEEMINDEKRNPCQHITWYFVLAFKSKLPARTYKFTDITGKKNEA